MDNQKATYPSKVRLSEFFFTIVAMASECVDKTCKFSSNDFKHRPKMLLPHSDNHSFIPFGDSARVNLSGGFVSDSTNDTSQVTLWKLMNHFMIV